MLSFFSRNTKKPESDAPTPVCHICAHAPAYTCVACAKSACSEPWHIYSTFGTKRYGTDNDQIGSKFFYYCPHCEGLNCKSCLGIEHTYPCQAEDLELHPFACAKCGNSLELLKFDNVDYTASVSGLARYINETKGEVLKIEPAQFEFIRHNQKVWEYKGHHTERKAKAGDLLFVPFGPVDKALSPDESWATLLGIYMPEADDPTFELVFFAQKQKAQVYWVENGERLHWIGTLHPKLILKSENFECIPRDIRTEFPFRVVLSAAAQGLHIAVHNQKRQLVARKMGIVRTGMFLPSRENTTSLFTTTDSKPFSDGWLVSALKQVSDLKIWDYEWIEAPQDDKPEAGDVLSIAGSTDLMYYHLVHLYFFGVKYFNIHSNFSHPHIAEASPVENALFREMYTFDERTMVYAVDMEWGSFLGDRKYIICNNVKVVMGHLKYSLVEIHYPENDGWWYKS